MNLLDVLRSLRRRWYIVVPGLVLAIGAAVGAWLVVAPTYERTATQLLLPGPGTLPDGASNPYLYLGGLTAPTDVLVRSVSSEDSLRGILEEFPDTEIEILRDPVASGPVVLTKVTAASDANAGKVLELLIGKTEKALDQLQAEGGVAANDRITITTVSIDAEGKRQQRDRLVASAVAAIALTLLTIVAASVVDGLASRVGHRGRAAKPGLDENPTEAFGSEEPEPSGLYPADVLGADDLDMLSSSGDIPVREGAHRLRAGRSSDDG